MTTTTTEDNNNNNNNNKDDDDDKTTTTTTTPAAAAFSRVPSNFVSYRPVCRDDVDVIADIESNSYPEDEMASKDTLQYRCDRAPEMFLVATEGNEDEIIGYACGTCVNENETLTAETMGKSHDPNGTILCIHSVVVKASKRRRGQGAKLLRAYLVYLKALNNDRKRENKSALKSCRLLCKKHLIPFYCDIGGFTLLGESDVTHGKDPWFDCEYAF